MSRASEQHILRIVAVLFGLLVAKPVGAQRIEDVRFAPPDPEPDGVLSLYVSLLDTPKDEIKISVRLTTWTDLDDDCTYAGEDEEVRHPPIVLRDNDPGLDQEPEPGEILMDIFKVPPDKVPRRYAVSISTETHRKTHSVKISQVELQCPESKRLGLSDRLIALLMRGGSEESGPNRLWVYDLRDQSVRKLLHYDKGILRTPRLSKSNDRIVFTAIENGGRRIGWTPITPDVPRWLTAGPEDDFAHWLSTGERVIFLRRNRLHVASISGDEIRPVATDLRIERISGVRERAQRGFEVFVEVQSREDPTSRELRMLVLGDQLELQDNIPLVDDPIWQNLHAIAPRGERYVSVDEERRLFIQKAGGEQLEVRLLKPGVGYFEPSWSPTDEIIVFLSDGP